MNDNYILQFYISPSIDETIEEIISFRYLERGWEFGRGDSIASNIIDEALEIHYIGRKLGFITEAVPETDGGITLTFVKGEDVIDIAIHPDLTCTVTHEKGIGLVFTRLARKKTIDSLEAIKHLYSLDIIKVIPCRSCEFLPPDATVKVKSDFTLDRASTTTGIASQWWSWTASVKSPGTSAPI